eukprot:UN06165
MGGFSIWGFVLYSGFFPFIASILLVITPHKLRTYSYRALKALFFFDFWGKFYPMIHFFLVFEGIILGYLIKDAYLMTHEQLEPSGDNLASVAALSLHPKSKQWRAQRNCYATAWAFTSWWMLYTLLAYEAQMDSSRNKQNNKKKKKLIKA